MWRFLAGVASALLLVTGGFFIWRAQADQGGVAPLPPAAAAAPLAAVDLAPPPVASERTREEKRFARYDRDRNGLVAREEYLLSRRKAFAKLDTNGDGRLGFEEYAVRTSTKFAAADKDRNGTLNAGEFATTRVVRKAAARCACPPARRTPLTPPPASEEPAEE